MFEFLIGLACVAILAFYIWVSEDILFDYPENDYLSDDKDEE